MGVIGGVFESRASLENPRIPLSDTDAWNDIMGGGPTTAGVVVTPQRALTDAPWWRGINLISATVAKLPLFVNKRVGEGQERDPGHPAYNLLRYRPNKEMSAFTFWQTLMGHKLWDGDGIAFITRKGNADPVELIPLLPGKRWRVRVNGRSMYAVEVGQEVRAVKPEDIFHAMGFSHDGLMGYKLLEQAREEIAGGLAAREHGNRYFKNAARGSLVLSTPHSMSREARQRFITSINNNWTGLENHHRVLLLEQDMKATQVSDDAKSSQLLEIRGQLHYREISNFLGVPPHTLGDPARTSFNSLEQENQSLLDNGIDPHLVPNEQECREKLLTERQKREDTHVIEYVRQALIRVDIVRRGSFYRTALGGAPFMAQNEVRAREGLAPMPGGDEVPQPLNMKGAASIRAAQARIVVDALHRMRTRLTLRVVKAAAKPDKFDGFLDSFERENEPIVRDALRPALEAVALMENRSSERLLAEEVGKLFRHVRESAVEVWSTAPRSEFRKTIEIAMQQVVDEGNA